MRDIATRSPKDRTALFRAVSQEMGINEAIIEKDFWVCWVLDLLFSDSPWRDSLNFKGGTSLSKAFDLIHRFSEDIDLIIDWCLLGFTEGEPWDERSIAAQGRFVDEANLRAVSFIADTFIPGATQQFSAALGTDAELVAEGHNVHFRYPRSFDAGYIKPEVVLEMGAMAAWVPFEPRSISPFVAQRRPSLFKKAATTVRAVAAERTFWEKATILHQEAHRSPDKAFPQRYSRHYYDLFMMINSPVREKAFERIDLLRDVVQFKEKFYRSPWARYEEALTGELRLLPPEHHLDELRKDYAAMRGMLFGEIPNFDSIIAALGKLEIEVNDVKRKQG
jgi:hypothetical protein